MDVLVNTRGTTHLLQRIGNALTFLFLFVIMLDPTNQVLHVKDIVFVLLVAYNVLFFKPSFKYLPHICAVLVAMTAGWVFAQIQQNPVDSDKMIAMYKSVSPLVLLLWVKYYDYLSLSVLPAVLTCLLMLILYVLAYSSPVIEWAMHVYFKSHGNMVMMTHRSFAGIRVFGMYYKSFICLSFAMYVVLYRCFNTKGRWKLALYIVLAAIFFAVSLSSGTRASMILPFCMVCLIVYNKLSKGGKARYFIYPFLALLCVGLLGVMLMLAAETEEASNVIKYGHLVSYAKLFTDHPLYLLVGQGPGTSFYTEGFRAVVDETEWTYLEMIRNYGLFSLLIVTVLLYPLKDVKAMSKDLFQLGVMGVYVMYLFVAGTNPLLFSSTGMAMIIIMYSFVENYRVTR